MLIIDADLEYDGRWISEVAALPGVMVYDTAEAEAPRGAAVLVQRVVVDRIEHDEPVPHGARARFVLARSTGRT